MTPKQAVDCLFELYGVRYPGADSLLDYLEEKGFVVVPETPTREMLDADGLSDFMPPGAWDSMIKARPR